MISAVFLFSTEHLWHSKSSCYYSTDLGINTDVCDIKDAAYTYESIRYCKQEIQLLQKDRAMCIVILNLVLPAKAREYVFTGVCLCVCLCVSVCDHDN